MTKILMRTRVAYFLCGALVIMTASFFAYVAFERSGAQPFVRAQCNTSNEIGDAYIVAAVGDSWVAGGKLDSGLMRGLAKSGVDATVKTSGHPGARSKLVFQNMAGWIGWVEQSYPSHTKMFVIEGGINDALAYVGKDFYIKHMRLAVDAAVILPINQRPEK